MASTFPGAIDSFTDPLSGSPLNSPSHSAQHADLNDAAEKIETYMGLVKVIPTVSGSGVSVSSTGTVTLTATATAQINTCFTSLYLNYRVIMNLDVYPGSATNINMQMSVAGTPVTTTNTYYTAGNEQAWNSPGLVTFGNNGASGFASIGRNNGLDASVFIMDIYNPQSTVKTFYRSLYQDVQYTGSLGGLINTTTSYDGLKILNGTSSNMTGTIRIYGYRN
jgi:hypothetical protein